MSYTNETTHYGIPLPLGSDLTTPMEYNASMQALDTAVFESKTDSSSALQKANQLQEDLADTKDDVTALDGRLTSVEGIQTTQGQNILQNAQDIADVRADALDMICAVDEGTAQVATVAVQEGKYFRYNDVLYIATDDIAIGDTIVPNTNCRATNIATELESAEDVSSRITSLETRVDTIETDLAKHELGTDIDLTTYTSSTMFVAPSDGYITASTDASSTSYGTVRTTNGVILIGAVGNGVAGTILSAFVRKGMSLYGEISGSPATALYKPLV